MPSPEIFPNMGRTGAAGFERGGRLCSVALALFPDGSSEVTVWTPMSNGSRRRINTFTEVQFHVRLQRAAIVHNIRPSLQAEVKRLMDNLMTDYQWERNRLRRARQDSA